MPQYEFDVIVAGETFSDEDCDRVYEAGGDDTLPVSRDGRRFLCFDREAASLEAAITSALDTVRRAGLQVKHVELESPTPVGHPAAERVA